MARPATKSDLLAAAGEGFDKLRKLIDSMTDEYQNAEFGFEDRDRNVRDVLIHLCEWHRLLLNWIEANRDGKPKPFLPEPYNWKTYSGMNVEFWRQHQSTPLAEAKMMLKESHGKVLALIEIFSNDELFARQQFAWTGGTTLGSYCVSATSSHYDWAVRKIGKHVKSYRPVV
ncbi:MAG: ClbS/DfsB family four-helix bundle protein [Rikenellaceae bacterium]|jgi:hypothetical protein|nr:ClbS/DfsB family four-helix bundle protein [Rikenellaceae bacterium]